MGRLEFFVGHSMKIRVDVFRFEFRGWLNQVLSNGPANYRSCAHNHKTNRITDKAFEEVMVVFFSCSPGCEGNRLQPGSSPSMIRIVESNAASPGLFQMFFEQIVGTVGDLLLSESGKICATAVHKDQPAGQECSEGFHLSAVDREAKSVYFTFHRIDGVSAFTGMTIADDQKTLSSGLAQQVASGDANKKAGINPVRR